MLAYLIPCCPVARSRNSSSSNNIEAQVSSFEMKKGKGRTGVEFRFYSDKEYQQLSPAQRKELKEYRHAQGKKSSEKSFPEKSDSVRTSQLIRKRNLARRGEQTRMISIRK